MNNSTLTISLSCKHTPKIIKKIGKINNQLCEILVCKDCRNDPDLRNFSEEKLQ